MNPENITLKPRSIALLFGILLVNIVILSPIAIIILGVKALYGIVFAIIMSAIEYFFVDELKEEGDLANPLIILFAFSLLFFNTLQEIVFVNLVVFLQYILIGLGTGVLISIIIFRLLRNTKINLFHELFLVVAAVLTYLLTEQLNGSGLFAILIMGMFFGNSYVRQNSDMKSFSPYIIKSLEIIIFLLVGFIIIPEFYTNMIIGSIIIFIAYLIVRLIVINIAYSRYSLQNKILLTAAPKGIVYASLILVLGTSRTLPAIMINIMFLIIIYSLIVSIIIEYIENEKIKRIEHIFRILKSIRYGRKKDLNHRHRTRHS
jgi:cell volume regulation protein A